MNFGEMVDKVNSVVEQFIQENMKPASAEELGLDERSFYGEVYVSNEYIAAGINSNRSLQYYGGFEYVDEENRTQVGEYVFYSADSDRVADCIALWVTRDE